MVVVKVSAGLLGSSYALVADGVGFTGATAGGTQGGGAEVAAPGVGGRGEARGAAAEVLAAPAGLLGSRTPPVDEVDRELVEEAARGVVAGRAPRGADEGPGDVEPLLGAGDADVGEAALLLELGLVAQRALVGEDAVLEAGEEDDGELQALGGVQRHQGHHAGVVAVRCVGDLVGVGDEGDPLEEVAEPDGDGWRLDLGRSAYAFSARRHPLEHWVVDAASMAVTGTIVLQHSLKMDAENQGSGVPNYLGPLTISPDALTGDVVLDVQGDVNLNDRPEVWAKLDQILTR